MINSSQQYTIQIYLSSSTFISELLRFRTNLLWVCNLLSAFLFTGFFTKVVEGHKTRSSMKGSKEKF